MARIALVALVTLVTALGCAPRPATQVVVRIEADGFPASDPITTVHVEAQRQGATAPFVAMDYPLRRADANGGFTLPGDVGLTPRDPGDARAFNVLVRATLESGRAVVHQAGARFSPGRVTYLVVTLSARCISVTCGEGTTCTPSGRCERITTVPEGGSLPEYPRGGIDAAPALDAVVDAPAEDATSERAPLDAVVDAPADADADLDAAPPDAVDGAPPFDVPGDVPGDGGAEPTPDGAADATGDVVPDVVEPTDVAVVPPRPIAPLSTSTTTRPDPTLRWLLPGGTVDGARVEVCRDAACATVVRRLTAVGESVRVVPALGRGVWFWRVFGRARSVTGTRPGPVWQFHVRAPLATVVTDTSWGSVPDFDNDGRSDIAIGANSAAAPRGQVTVRYSPWRAPPRPVTVLTSATPPGRQATFGQLNSLASAGDVNGDGFADLIVGAYRETDAGRVYVFRGGANGVDATPMNVLDNPDTGGESWGHAVTSIGDVDRDGYADVAISGYASGLRAYVTVHRGGPGGVAAAAMARLMPPSGANLAVGADFDGDGDGDVAIAKERDAPETAVVWYRSIGTTLDGPYALDPPGGTARYGRSLAAGDFNGDGFADIATGSHERGVFVYAGGAARVAAAPSASIALTTRRLDEWGDYLAFPGDVDGDGFEDLAVGAILATDLAGLVEVYAGNAFWRLASPVTLRGTGTERLGVSLGRAADLDGDGINDLLVGTYGTPRTVYIYLGASPFPTSASDSISGSFDDNFGISLASLLVAPAREPWWRAWGASGWGGRDLGALGGVPWSARRASSSRTPGTSASGS